jgi:hypothetical protein
MTAKNATNAPVSATKRSSCPRSRLASGRMTNHIPAKGGMKDSADLNRLGIDLDG